MMNSLEVLGSLLAFDTRDWSLVRNDALIYGIVVGWDEASLAELQVRFGLDQERVVLMRTLHADFRQRMEHRSGDL